MKILVLLPFVFAGCASMFGPQHEAIVGPDGTPHELVSCSDIKDCYQAASTVCGGHYKIVNTSADTSGGGTANTMVTTTTKLLVKCQ